MEVKHTKIKDCFILKPKVFHDARGYFMEAFNAQSFNAQTGLTIGFVQENESESTFGVIRGLHAQEGSSAQAKLVRVLKGVVLDVVVDFRQESATYLQHICVKLSAENKQQLFVPRGCLHGFSVLSESATFFYKCDNYYHKEAEIGFRFDDPHFNIDWQISKEQAIISEKDLQLPFLKDL
mgnify:CR=1 FL=1